MDNTGGSPLAGYRPDMDGEAHESTYESFTHFTAVAGTAVACCVAALAVGGVRAAWMSAMLGIVLTLIATPVGLFTPLAWRAPAAVLVLMLVMLLLY